MAQRRTLREWRARRLLTVRGLATLAGVRPQTVLHIEHGAVVPQVGTMQKIAQALQVQPEHVTEFADAIQQRGAGGKANAA